MKTCPNCGGPIDDGEVLCRNCGTNVENVSRAENAPSAPQTPPEQKMPQTPPYTMPQTPPTPPMPPRPQIPQGQIPPMPQYQPQAPAFDPYDHTAEFDGKDVSDNKVYAMLCYLLGAVGIIIALLACPSSKFVSFHVRQAIKFEVVGMLALIASVVLFWTIIVPIAYAVFSVALVVCRIITFVQICCGRAVEPYIIRSIGFLK